MKHVVFEGVDGSGKSTLIRLFNWRSGHVHLTSDRWLLSYAVYDKRADLSGILHLARSVAGSFENTVIFLLEAPGEVLWSRLVSRDPSLLAVERRIVDWGDSWGPTKAVFEMLTYRSAARSFADFADVYLVDATGDPTLIVDEMVALLNTGTCAGTFIIRLTESTQNMEV